MTLGACSLANCPGKPYPAAFRKSMETKGIEPFTNSLQGSFACPWNMRPRQSSRQELNLPRPAYQTGTSPLGHGWN